MAWFDAVSVAGWGFRYTKETRDESAQRFAGNAGLGPAFRAPGMDTRAGEFDVMDIPWGVAPRAPVQGLMKHHTGWQ
jgi:hypothetical protein